MELDQLRDTADAIRDRVGRAVVGQEETVTLLLVALLAEGHVLLEGVPGTAKTLLARAFAKTLSLRFKRIQFTPDLMPGDLVGTNIFNFQTHEFVLKRGPVFTDLLLADEINRTPPKTQAALLESMQERVVTIDGESHALGSDFTVIATQNPIEQEGTYPLPEAQLDRFLFKADMGYPSREEECDMVRRHGNRSTTAALEELGVEPVAGSGLIAGARQIVSGLHLGEDVVAYVVELVRATREHGALRCGASPRSANLLASASRAHAALDGRDYVLPDDVQALAEPALAHRLLLAPGAEIEGIDARAVVREVVERVPVPR